MHELSKEKNMKIIERLKKSVDRRSEVQFYNDVGVETRITSFHTSYFGRLHPSVTGNTSEVTLVTDDGDYKCVREKSVNSDKRKQTPLDIEVKLSLSGRDESWYKALFCEDKLCFDYTELDFVDTEREIQVGDSFQVANLICDTTHVANVVLVRPNAIVVELMPDGSAYFEEDKSPVLITFDLYNDDYRSTCGCFITDHELQNT